MEKQKSDNIEVTKRVRAVLEWIIDDWSKEDIENQCMQSWGISDRQARDYIKKAKKIWEQKDNERLESKRKKRLAALYKLKRRLEIKYQGTPQGVMAVLNVEKTIIELEGLKAIEKHEHSGVNGAPIQTETTHRVIFENYAG